MEVVVEDISALRKSLKIVLPSDFVVPKIEAAFNKLKKQVNLKGFRKGKTPRKVLEKTYGEQVKNEVSETLIQETYFDALSEVKIEAVVHPDIKSFDYSDDGSFKYEAEVEVKPEFELGDYKGIEVEAPEITITDAEIDEAIEFTRREMAPLKSVDDRAAQTDDLVIIDFQGFENGEAMKNIVGTEYPIDVGSGRNGKEFEDIVIGVKKGEEVTKEVDFPADFANPVMAGKKIEFVITVKDVKERLLPELDDEFAKDVSDEFANLDDLRSSVTQKIRGDKQKTVEGDVTDKIMLKLLDNHEFDLPARLVAYEINQLVEEMENNLKNQGLTLESAGMNREQLAEYYKESASRRVKGEFIIKKIAEIEEIKLSDEDITAGYERIAQQYNMSLDEVKKYFQTRNDLLPFMNELLSEKILKFIREAAKVTYVTPEPEADTDKADKAGDAEGDK